MRTVDVGRITAALAKNKYVLLVLALGLLLLLLPRSTTAAAETTPPAVTAAPTGRGDPMEASGIPLDTEAERLAALLRKIRGVGDAEVLLSKQGAVVVCAGADSAQARLEVTEAVSAYTGLGSDKILVMKMKNAGG